MVGLICESGDVFGIDCCLFEVSEGDVVLIV